MNEQTRRNLQANLGGIPDAFESSIEESLSKIPLDENTAAAFHTLSKALKDSLAEICLCISPIWKKIPANPSPPALPPVGLF